MWLSGRDSNAVLIGQIWIILHLSLFLSQAILLVELVYAVVGISWLVQYYQPCSDVTAKNLALGEREREYKGGTDISR